MEEVKEILAPASNGMLIAIIILLLMFVILLVTRVSNRHSKDHDDDKADWKETKKIVSDLVTISKIHELRLTNVERDIQDLDYEVRVMRGGPIVTQPRKEA